ncbi:hypothetical protein IAG44_11835 [Streptomyces roseirectus]|uniref:PH domain-containing protein n=1 Tax=Streptomyces roseirectus TaxID=2768066 RepID=A0A7H0IBA6_9ACTN|nr:hypothetical protein [Streptomyces roseirectus]QNP70072.1 hypothetical protein IAG44_11835 [Streptomyces roseirectus]
MNPPGPYRLSRRQVRRPLVLAYAPSVTLLLVMTLSGAWVFSARELPFMVLGTTAAVLLVPFLNDDQVRLTEFNVRFRRHKVRWSEITLVEVRSLLGVRQVVLHTVSGKRRTLPAPHSFADPEFDRKAREITDWWERHRG